MSSPIVQFTNAGLAELIDAKRLGIKGIITHISAGDKGYTPSPTQRSLQRERQRVEVADFEDLSATQIRLGAKFTGDAEYEVREVGFWLESGTLLAVYSMPNQLLTYKSANSSWIQKFTLDISALPTDSITVEVGVDNLNLMLLEELTDLAICSLQSLLRELEQFYSNREKELMVNQKLSELSRKNEYLEAHIRGIDSKLHLLIPNVFASLASAQIDTMHRQMKDYYIN